MKSWIKYRVVIDTNVFISGLIWGGDPKRILNKWLKGEFDILTSPYLVFEIISVYERFNNPQGDIEKLKTDLTNKTIKVIPREITNICRDEKDNQILDLCLAGRADFLITDDKDLLILKKFEKTRIIRPKEFLKLIKK